MGEEFPQKFGQYTLHELIGRGGMAEIYRATMPGIGGFEKTVAIKKILPHLAEDDEFTSMLIDEARIIESLDHSNIAQVFDLGKREGTYYIAMEYIHGLDLSEIIEELEEQGKYIPIPHVIHITSSICAGLHFAHSKTDEKGNPLNVIHRDISPHNIRLSFAGEVKIIDFGIAKAADREAHTKMGVIKGKLLYMAPEQAKAEDLDGRADLFATGLCAYKMLTGELPFEGENEFQVYNNILQKDIVPPLDFRPEIPEELNRIVMKLLRRDRDERYQEGYEAKQDLDRLLHDIAPGYTVNRLSQWVEENFSHLLQQEGDPEHTTATSNPSDMNPATPTGQRNPGTGQHGAAELEAERADTEQVREPVPADGGQGLGDSPTQPARPDQVADGGDGGGAHRTETSSDQATGQFQTDQKEESSGPPGVVYAIVALLVAIAGMVTYALTVEKPGPGTDDPSDKKKKTVAENPDESEGLTGLVNVNIDSKPEDAELVRKGEVVGRTPTRFVLPKGKEAIEVTLVKSGYEDQTIGLVPTGDLQKTIELKALPDGGVASGPDAGSADAQKEGKSASEDDEEQPSETSPSSGSDDSSGGKAPEQTSDEDSSDGDESSDDDWGGVGATPDRDEGSGSGSTDESTSSTDKSAGAGDESGSSETSGDSDKSDESGGPTIKTIGTTGDDSSGGGSSGDDSKSSDDKKEDDEDDSTESSKDDEIIDPFAN